MFSFECMEGGKYVFDTWRRQPESDTLSLIRSLNWDRYPLGMLTNGHANYIDMVKFSEATDDGYRKEC